MKVWPDPGATVVKLAEGTDTDGQRISPQNFKRGVEGLIPLMTLGQLQAGSIGGVRYAVSPEILRRHLVERNDIVTSPDISAGPSMEARKQYNALPGGSVPRGSYIQIIDEHQVSPGTTRDLRAYLRAGDNLDSSVTDLILQWDTANKYTIAPRTPTGPDDANQNTWSTPAVDATAGIWRNARNLLLPAGTVIEWAYESTTGYYPWSGRIIGNINAGKLAAGTAAEIVAGLVTDLKAYSPAVLKEAIDQLDDSRGLHASRRIDYDLVKGWFDARGETGIGIVQIIVGVYSATTPTDRAKDIYIRSTAGTDVESGFTSWLTAQRYSLSGGVATADAMGGYRRAQDVTLPVGTMIQWLLAENGRDYVGRIFFGPGAGSPLSGSAGQIIANTVTSPRVYSPNEIHGAINSLAPPADWNAGSDSLSRILNKPVPVTLEDLRNLALSNITAARTISIAVLRQIIATTPPDIHGNERHNPDFAIASELLAEITNRIAADNAHRTLRVANTGEMEEHPIHGNVVDGYWRDVSGYGDTLNMPVTFAAPTLTLGSVFRSGDAARFTSGNFVTTERRIVRWGFAFAADAVYLGIVGYSPAPPAQGRQDGPSGQQSIVSSWRYNEIGLLQYSAAGAQVGTDTLWETYNPEQTTLQGADVLQGYIAGANIYWLMADQTGNGFSLTAYNLATGSYQTALSGDETTRFGAPGKAARGAWGTATRQFICYADGEIREYNPADGNLVRTFATLPAGSVSSAVPASGRLRGDANYLYALTGSSAATVGYVAYDLTTRERAPEKELAAFRLTSIADLWDFQVKPGPQGVAELYYSTLPTDYPTTFTGADLLGYVSAQRSESYGVPTLGLVLERSDNLPPVEIDGFPVIGPRDANFVRAVYEALLRGDTAADGKTVGYDADRNAIRLNVPERRPTLIFTPTTVGNDIVVAWRVAVPLDQADANFFRGSFRLNNVVGSGQTGSATFLGLTDVGESDYIGHGGELVKVNAGATGLEFGSELALSDDVPPAIAAAGSAGTGTEASRDDHTHAGITGAGAALSDDVPPAIAAAGSAGTGTEASRDDHTHAGITGAGAALSDDAPPAIAAAGSAGTGTEASRDDHTHAGLQLSDATPGNTPGTAGPGTATTAARGDHDHGISPGRGGVGTTITYSTANPVNTATPSPGSSAAVARADHDHGFTRLPLSDTQPRNQGVVRAGTSLFAARGDHDHGIRVTQTVTRTVAAVAGDTLTGDGTTASPLGVRIPWHSSMVTELARVLQGTSPLAVAESGGLVNITAATLVSRLTAVETRLTALEAAG